jgi:hypothetical protein
MSENEFNVEKCLNSDGEGWRCHLRAGHDPEVNPCEFTIPPASADGSEVI